MTDTQTAPASAQHTPNQALIDSVAHWSKSIHWTKEGLAIRILRLVNEAYPERAAVTAQHTSGPWTLGNHHHEHQTGPDRDAPLWSVPIWANDATPGERIAAEAFAFDRNQARANARLIASAPALLAACVGALATYRTFRSVPRDEQEWTSLDDDALNALFAAIAQAKE